MVSSLKPPISTSTASAGYTGGSLARTITSNDLQPAESIVARRRGELTLRERDTIDRIPSRRSEETGDVRAVPGEAYGDGDEEGKEKPRLEDSEVDEVDPAGMPEEWTFPDGGAKAWSVILVRFDRVLRKRERGQNNVEVDIWFRRHCSTHSFGPTGVLPHVCKRSGLRNGVGSACRGPAEEPSSRHLAVDSQLDCRPVQFRACSLHSSDADSPTDALTIGFVSTEN